MTAPGTTPTPSTRPVRIFAGAGLLLLPVALVAWGVIVLEQAYSGDGASGPLGELALWSLGFSGLLGLWALSLPQDAVRHAVRRGAVCVQYALALACPLLAAVDFA
ncbi:MULTISPECIES: hypothetical protein [unclassified Streptomyces]|uniref:hypothetical protein n=1 Tax=unclassified Streptomyces TaxID=2593676 RepID=UPI0004C7B229|nr:hypothetical protein [Streptomyces sp. NRRL S-118]